MVSNRNSLNLPDRPLRILLVEDSKHDRLVFRRAFTKNQVSVEITEFERTESALDRLETDASSFDLLVTDYKLPGMSGIDLCKELVARQCPLPLVVLTGAGSESLAVEALKAGVDDYLVKDPRQGYLKLLPLVLVDVMDKHWQRQARQRAEQALRKAELRYRTVADFTYDWEYWESPDGALNYVSPACERITGYTADRFISNPQLIQEIIWPEDREIWDHHYHLATETPGLREVQFRIQRRDGEIIWIEHACQPVTDEQGTFLGFRASNRDITERVRAEKSVRKANRAYKVLSDCNRGLLRATGEIELLQEVCRIIVEASGYRLAWVGFAEEDGEKTVRPVAQVGYEEGYLDRVNITWADTERGRGPTGTAIRTGRPIVTKDILTNPDYAPWRTDAIKRGYASSIALPLITDGQALGALNIYAPGPNAFDDEEVGLLMELADNLAFGIMTLRTQVERVRAEGALRESEQQLSLIYDSIGDVLYYLAVEPNDCFRFLSINQAFLNATGLNEEQIVGKRIEEVIPEPSVWMVRDNYKKAIEENRIVRWEETSVYSAGKKIGDVSIAPVLNEEGICTHLVGSVHDITERVQAEEQIAASLKEKEVLLKEIHHRVKNNLATISSLLGLQASQIQDERVTHAFKESQRRIKSMGLVHEMLYQSPDLAQIDFTGYIQQLASYLFSTYNISPDSVQLQVDVGEVSLDIDPAIYCGLIINELISNSLKHAFPEGRTGELHLQMRQNGEETTLLVSDNGVGLPEDLEWRNTDSLGLQLVTMLTEQLKGEIQLDRTSGTTFMITFPNT